MQGQQYKNAAVEYYRPHTCISLHKIVGTVLIKEIATLPSVYNAVAFNGWHCYQWLALISMFGRAIHLTSLTTSTTAVFDWYQSKVWERRRAMKMTSAIPRRR